MATASYLLPFYATIIVFVEVYGPVVRVLDSDFKVVVSDLGLSDMFFSSKTIYLVLFQSTQLLKMSNPVVPSKEKCINTPEEWGRPALCSSQ